MKSASPHLSGSRTGAGGYATGMGVDARGHSYDLMPDGDRIPYTIDISTPEDKKKLYKLPLEIGINV